MIGYSVEKESKLTEFLEAGSDPFKPFPDKDTLMSYYEIPPEILEQPDDLAGWALCSLAIQKKK